MPAMLINEGKPTKADWDSVSVKQLQHQLNERCRLLNIVKYHSSKVCIQDNGNGIKTSDCVALFSDGNIYSFKEEQMNVGGIREWLYDFALVTATEERNKSE